MTELTDIDVDLVAETEKALLVRDADGKEAWLPKSLLGDWTGKVGGPAVVEMPQWLAEREGFA